MFSAFSGQLLSNKTFENKIVVNDDLSRHFSYMCSVVKCLSMQNVSRPSPTSVRDIIARYRETRISDGLPGVHHNGRHHSTWLRYTENSWDIAVWCVEEKRERLNVEEEKDWGDIALKVFQTRTYACTHVTCVLVGRDDPPTHSCWRSVVDDNGNPIFRNNICLEDRRLTSCDADVYACVFVCVFMYAQYKVFHSYCDVSHSIFSTILTLWSRIEKNSHRYRDTDNYGNYWGLKQCDG